MLVWSRIEAGEQNEISNTDFDPAEWISNLITVYRFQAGRKNIELRTEIGHLPAYISADQPKLTRITENLLSNAIKFSPSGSVISLHAELSAGNQLHMIVSDQGSGIPEEMIDKIFLPYVSQLNQKVESTGLGLPIARHLACVLGGNLWANNNPDKGSRFTLHVPVTIATRKPATVMAAENMSFSSLKNLSAVVIDDDRINHRVAQLTLESLGMNITCFESGQEGLAFLQQHQADLVVMDINMPNISGREITENPEIRSHHPAYPGSNVIR